MRVALILWWLTLFLGVPLPALAEHDFRVATDFPGGSVEILGIHPLLPFTFNRPFTGNKAFLAGGI